MMIYDDITICNDYHNFYLNTVETGNKYLTFDEWLASVGAELFINHDSYAKAYYTLKFRNPEDEVVFRLKYTSPSL